MKPIALLRYAVVALMIFSAHLPASIAAVIHQSFTVDLADFKVSGTPGVFRSRVVGIELLDRFSVSTGDTVITDVTFTGGPFTMYSRPSGGNEFIRFYYSAFAQTAQVSTTVTGSLAYHNPTGDLNNLGASSFSFTNTNDSPLLFFGSVGNITSSSGSFTGLTLTSTIDAITDPNLSWGALTIDMLDGPPPATGVAAPGTLALLAMGLLGYRLRRGTRGTAASKRV